MYVTKNNRDKNSTTSCFYCLNDISILQVRELDDYIDLAPASGILR
jgi:hypothetical protein